MPGAPARTTLKSALSTWPRKIAALIGTVLLTSALGYFFGPDFWGSAAKNLGLAGKPVQAQVIADVDRFSGEAVGSGGGPAQTRTGAVHAPEFLVPRPLDQIGPPPSGKNAEGRYAWAHDMGGVDAWDTLIRVVISGKSASPVLLEDLNINVISRRHPPSGTYISYTGLGAAVGTRFVDVDLDSQPPRWQFIGDNSQPTDNPFPLQVTDTEVEVFDIEATTSRCDCTWTAELLYSADGEDGTLSITNGGRPFETTAVQGWTPNQVGGEQPRLTSYHWLHGRWAGS